MFTRSAWIQLIDTNSALLIQHRQRKDIFRGISNPQAWWHIRHPRCHGTGSYRFSLQTAPFDLLKSPINHLFSVHTCFIQSIIYPTKHSFINLTIYSAPKLEYPLPWASDISHSFITDVDTYTAAAAKAGEQPLYNPF